MSNPIDRALDNFPMEVENVLQKSAMKRATKKSQTVEYTAPDGISEGVVTVEICQDGERHFVEISVYIPYLGSKKLVSVDDDSRGGALAKAEEAFSETEYGSISLDCLTEDEGDAA